MKDKGKDIGTRLGSMILDHFIMSFASIIIGMVFVVIILVIIAAIIFFAEDVENSEPIFPVIMFLLALIVYPIYFNKDAFGGRSPAKRILKLIVVDHKTNEVATPIQTVIRNVTLFFWPVEVIYTLTSPDRRLGDYIAGTRVIEDDGSKRRRPKASELVLSFLIGMVFMIPIMVFAWFTGLYN